MTREEKIAELINIRDNFNYTLAPREVFDDAIKAIKQSCEDTVSRQDVVETIDDCNSDGLKGIFCSYDDGERFKEYINKLPPVTPTRKKGKWIGHREHCENLGVIPSGLGAYEWCSNCDCGIDVREWHRNHYNYCPNCGAEMESEE